MFGGVSRLKESHAGRPDRAAGGAGRALASLELGLALIAAGIVLEVARAPQVKWAAATARGS